MQTKPNNAVILGIDSGATSGWSIFIKDQFYISSIARNHDERKRGIVMAAFYSENRGLPLIVGREAWSPGWGKKRTFKSIVGTGAAWGKWEELLESFGLPKRRIFTVTPNVWRKAILGLKVGRHTRDQAKASAIAYCKAKGWWNMDINELVHDAAEATCIAHYMVYDERVAKAIRHPSRLKQIKEK